MIAQFLFTLSQSILPYRSIDGAPSLEVGILMETMMGLSKHDTWAEACQEARVDWLEAVEESSSPRGIAGCIGDGGTVASSRIQTASPVVNVLLHVGLGLGGGSLLSHCEREKDEAAGALAGGTLADIVYQTDWGRGRGCV